MIENYEMVREAIAKWYGWTPSADAPGLFLAENGAYRLPPDPLAHGGDAWALQCAIVAKHWQVMFHHLFNETHHMKTNEVRYTHVCNLWHYGTPSAHITEDGATPSEALLAAWMQVFMD